MVMLGGPRGVAVVLLGLSDRSLGSLWRTRALLRVPWGLPWACSEVSWESRWASLVRDGQSLGVLRDALVDFQNH